MDKIDIDFMLVILFFVFFGMLTFFYIGIQMELIKDFIDKIKERVYSISPPHRRKIKTIPPELISAKYNKLTDFLTGRGKLRSFDNSISLFINNVTPVFLIGIPASVYLQGSQYFASLLSFPISVLLTNFTFLPVFFTLGVTTSNQYLDKRFNSTTKYTCLGLSIFTNLLKTAIWLNTPNLILSRFTVIGNEIGLILTVVIVVIYTSLGGMKVMQKMEKFQLSIMIFALTSVVSKGIADVGGLSKIWEENQKKDRFKMIFNPNPLTNRQVFWSVLATNTFSWFTTYSISQSSLNRFINSGTLSTSRRILYAQIPMMMVFFFVICFIGLLIYTLYQRCDPLMLNRIDRSEMLIGLFSSDINKERNGLLGLFIVGLYSTALSSISSSLNAITTIVFEDIIKKEGLKFHYFDVNSNLLLRLLMCLIGIVIVMIMLYVQHFTQISKLRTMLNHALYAPVFGVFLLGLHSRKVNSTCALVGLISGVLFGALLFNIHFEDSPLFLAIGTGVEDCIDYFCFKRPSDCDIDPLTHNKTIILSEDKLKKTIYWFPFSFDVNLLTKTNSLYDGWLITFFTMFVGWLMSKCFKVPDKSPSEIEECLAIYMQKDLNLLDLLNKQEPEADEIYEEEKVENEENEDKEKEKKEEKEDKEEKKKGSKEDNEKDKVDQESNLIDLNYLRKTIDDLLNQ